MGNWGIRWSLVGNCGIRWSLVGNCGAGQIHVNLIFIVFGTNNSQLYVTFEMNLNDLQIYNIYI